MYEFSASSGWTPIEDFLNKPEANGDLAAEIQLAGYYPTPTTFGTPNSGFSVGLFTAGPPTRLKYPHLLVIEINTDIEVVAVAKLPDLIELLHKLSTIAESAACAEHRLNLEREAQEIDM